MLLMTSETEVRDVKDTRAKTGTRAPQKVKRNAPFHTSDERDLDFSIFLHLRYATTSHLF